MAGRIRQFVAVLSIVSFLSAFAFADLGHAHFLPGNLNSTPSYQSHDCQDKEQHKPLDVRFHCVQSCRVLSLSYALTVDGFRPNVTVEYITLNDAQGSLSTPSLVSESKRGPPLS